MIPFNPTTDWLDQRILRDGRTFRLTPVVADTDLLYTPEEWCWCTRCDAKYDHCDCLDLQSAKARGYTLLNTDDGLFALVPEIPDDPP